MADPKVIEILNDLMYESRHYNQEGNLGWNESKQEALTALNDHYLSVFEELVGEEQELETVKIPCPDLEEGCLVYHMRFQMTPKIEAENNFRAQLLKAARERLTNPTRSK